MKTIFLLVIFNITSLGGPSFDWTEETRSIEAQQISLWEENLSSAKEKPPFKRIEVLSRGLRNMGYRRSFDGHSPEIDVIYVNLQTEILSIPGHAQYYADEIEREQKAVEQFPTNTGPRVSYDFNRSRHFQTLSHLPSPETIAVLGHFLYDDKDKPIEVRSPGSDWGDNPRANSYGSSAMIMNIGLRNPPVDIQRRNDNPDTLLAETRAWWEEIKSGKRTFSFIGQLVEYRFKPDGTWESTPLPESVLERDPKPAIPARVAVEQPAASVIVAAKPRWPWVLGGVTALLVGVAWLKGRRSAEK